MICCARIGIVEADYESRDEFTSPEILRSDLAEVILRMIDLGLGAPLEFPFIDRPASRAVHDGYDTLAELGAVRRGEDRSWRLTETGREMARMQLDPRISRMLIEARAENCAAEVAVLAAALSIRDPRERPHEKAAQADAVHAAFRHPDSDFLVLLNIWNRFHGEFEKLGTLVQKRRFCHEHFLSFPRMREVGLPPRGDPLGAFPKIIRARFLAQTNGHPNASSSICDSISHSYIRPSIAAMYFRPTSRWTE